MSRPSSRTERVYGFDNEVISVVKILEQQESDDEFKAIGIVGVRGVGKTALCQVLVNSPEVKKNNFVPRILVCMPKKEDGDPKVELVKRMLTGLGVDEKIIKSISKDHEIDGLLYALYLQLIGKRYLIVLDDADLADQWYRGLDSPISQRKKWGQRLAYGLPKGSGGRVIVTSRNEEIVKKMVGEDMKNIYRLLPLSDPESCWSIFRDAAGKDRKEFADDQANLKELKEELLHKCVGLPLAAKMLGQFHPKPEANESQVEATQNGQ